jgi:hemolysin activation/secretion protein
MMASTRIVALRKISLAGISLLALTAAPAMAQVGDATGIADPAKVGEQLRQPSMTPSVTPDIRVGDMKAQGVPAGAEKIKFTLNSLNFSGVSAYDSAQLEGMYADKIGQTITLADLYGIANQVMLRYRNDGYILTQVVVPPQEISGGNAKLQVVEGFVNNISVRKADDAAPINIADIESYAAQISTGGPLNVKDLERQLLIINDLPGVTARSVLSPSRTTAGAADMEIILDYDPVDAMLSIDNFGSRYLGDVQLGAAATLNSMLGRNEAISAQLVVAPDNWYELAYGSLRYEEPVGIYGTKMHVMASATDTEPGYDLEQFDVQGRSYLLNVGVTHPFIRSRSQNLYGRLDFDWRRVKSENNVEDTRRDRLSVLRAGGRYEFVDTFITAGANMIDLELSKGIDILGASDEGDDNMTRSEGDPQFTKLELEIQRLQRVTSNVNLLLSGRGQLASDALLSSEEFSVGGINSGRGFDPSEISGDEGISGRVELQWKDPVALDRKYVDTYQLYSFYDIGRVWNDDATTSSQKRDSLASVGGGVRFDLPQEFDAGFAVAFPLTREPQTANDYDPKFYFNLSKKF